MKLTAIALLAIGLLGAIFGYIKFKQQGEWEHWAEKLIWLLVSFGMFSLSVIGAIILYLSY